jgi:Fe2+ or Zn2+ uptake regulation protein
MTAEEIWLSAKEKMPSIVMATVYNNLNALAASGEIARIRVADGPDHFDKTVPPHFHLVCDKCGEMMDICGMSDPTDDIEHLAGVRPAFIELNAHYTCSKCMGGA